MKPEKEIRGLGDAVAKVTEVLGVQPCGGCKKRQEQLNYMIPFNWQHKPVKPEAEEKP